MDKNFKNESRITREREAATHLSVDKLVAFARPVRLLIGAGKSVGAVSTLTLIRRSVVEGWQERKIVTCGD